MQRIIFIYCNILSSESQNKFAKKKRGETMKRNIIKIDEEKCTGCGLCVDACQEGALKLIDGKAKLVSESYCDGLGNCLPECPAGAITIEEREAVPFDEKAVANNQEKPEEAKPAPHNQIPHQCPGSMARAFDRKDKPVSPPSAPVTGQTVERPVSELRQWPCQIKLMSPTATYLDGAHLLVAADCTAFAYANLHQDFIKGRITLIGCPKLDNTDYSEKLTEILMNNDIKSVTVVKMEVPCCSGLENAVTTAIKNVVLSQNKMIPWHTVTISLKGEILSQN